MKIDADLHNFGQQVTQVWRASEIYFQKPRPVYWEWFFFGKNSPLRPIFNQQNASSKKISETLFNLDVHFENGDCGSSKQVVEVDAACKPSHAYGLGVLLAYCYLFGIRDLHKGNVIRSGTHLQVIDAEVVFSKLLLPNETLLLPFKDVSSEICAAQKSFGDDITAIDLESLKLVLSGYLDLLSVTLEKRDQLVELLKNHREKMLTVPIRHIMRNTAHYRLWRENQTPPTIPFCADELKQLERGDVPYYFKFIGDTNLYAYTKPTGEYDAITAPIEFQKGINRDATDPLELLTASRLNDELLPTGSLFILKKLMPKGFTGSIDGGNFSAAVTDQNLQINFAGKTFTAKL